MPRRRAIAVAALAGMALVAAAPAGAVWLDADRRWTFRARLYSEAALATEGSQPQTMPARAPFQLMSHRTFFNPELEGDLRALRPAWLDDLSVRLALWGFYDGLYQYGPAQYGRARQGLEARVTDGWTNTAPVTRTDQVRDPRKIYTYQPDPVLGHDNGPGEVADLPFRVNEAYVNVTRGPLFLRLGRQSISWGESDTIALLDQSNPFDVTHALPGIFQDIDEARIPLWTARGTFRLLENWKALSGVFLDAYLVPGSIDTTVSPLPIPTVSPYSPPETDPQQFVDAFTSFVPADLRPLLEQQLGGLQFVQYDHLPSRTMRNSRWGVRLEGVVARDYTTSLWFYRTIAQNPVPRFLPLDLSRAPLFTGGRGGGPSQLITETVHGFTKVFGASLSFFSEPLNGVVRSEVEYFLDEPAFVPSENIPFQALLRQPALRSFLRTGLGVDVPPGPDEGRVPRADVFRWELGYDRFFFLRPLNPTNSFTLVTALVGSWNLSETFTGTDYRYYGQRKATDTGLRTGVNVNDLQGLADVPKLRTVDADFVDLKPVEWFLQGTLQTDYLHGRVTPRLTAIVNPRGTAVVPIGVTLRWSDRAIVDLRYVALFGGFFGTGFFRDRDQISARLTLLLN